MGHGQAAVGAAMGAHWVRSTQTQVRSDRGERHIWNVDAWCCLQEAQCKLPTKADTTVTTITV